MAMALVAPKAANTPDGVDWSVLGAVTVAAFAFDTFVLHGLDSTSGHFMSLMVWAVLAFAYSVVVISMHGVTFGVEWWTAYVLEWLLNVDNLFIFLLVFTSLRTPAKLRQVAMTYWIPFAIALRIVLYSVIQAEFDMHACIKVLCGLMLVYSGLHAALTEDDDDFDVDALWSVRCFRWLLGRRGSSEYDEEGRIFINRDERWCASMLLMVIFTLSVVDCLFVFDSVAAKVAQIPVQYIANSAEGVALFGMRSFIVFLEDIVETFELLKYGICLVLAFLGWQLILEALVPGLMAISPIQSTLVICVILLASMVASSLRVKKPDEGLKEGAEA
jgi:tellurite resistance protein TerC